MRQGLHTRLVGATKARGYTPAWTLQDYKGLKAYACGKCWVKLGDDPFAGLPGKMTPEVPKGAICTFCQKRAYPWDGSFAPY